MLGQVEGVFDLRRARGHRRIVASPAPSAPDEASLQRALQAAVTRAEAVGERFTLPRQRVLRLLLEAGRPLKAYDVIAATGRDGSQANPPTVYRALEFLTRLGLVHRIESDASYVVCSHSGHDHGHPPLMMVCDRCGSVAETRLEDIDTTARQAAAAQGFVLERLVVEARGLCAACTGAGAA